MCSSDDGNNNEDENALWGYVTRDIEPFHDKKDLCEKPFTQKKTKEENRPVPLNQEPPPRPTERGRDIDGRTAQRLQQGKIAIEARLDLHGMSQNEAHAELESFIINAHNQGKRLVLIITGKGNLRGQKDKSGENWMQEKPGVLKRRVPNWLDDNPLRNIVLQYNYARPQHGGEGALYVLLRRLR